MPGIDALAEMALSVSSALDIVTSLGIEAALGDSDLDICVRADNGVITCDHVDTIARLRGAGEVGIRLSF